MPERPDAYAGVARHYEIQGWDWWAATHGRRLISLLRDKGLRGGRILDAGCGTGSLALMLSKEGFQVTGLDLSSAMLDQARGKEGSDRVRWLTGDVTRLDEQSGEPREPFDAITCVGDILNHLETLADWEGAFRGFAACLRPEGWLYFDVMTARGLERLDGFSVQERDDRTLLVTTVYDRHSGRSTVKVTSFAPAPGTALWERASDTITEWAQPVPGILRKLEAAGFSGPTRPFATADDPELDDRLGVLARRGGAG